MLEIYKAVDAIADKLVEKGVALPEHLKRRDANEPGREMKEQYEDKLYKLTLRRFRIQKRNIAAHLNHFRPAKKAEVPDDLFITDDVERRLMQLFIAASIDGVNLFAINSTIGLDWTLVNTQVADWARTYVPQWLDDLDMVTRKALQSRLATFVETPGYTIADVMSDLVPTLGEDRALRIAVTEITRVFGNSEQIAGEALKKEFPDVRVVKEWFTNMDDRVCPICGPLQNNIVEVSHAFHSIVGGIMHPPAHVNCRCWMTTNTDILAGEDA
jgi:hypothetical protein